jgi:hypothetical protein
MRSFFAFEETIYTNPLIQIIILATPTYMMVAEVSNFSPLVHVHRYDAPERGWVWYPPINMLKFNDPEREQIVGEKPQAPSPL